MFKPIIGSVCFSNSFWSLLIINNAIFFIQEKKTKQGKQSKKKKLLKNKNKKKESKEQIKTYLLKPFKPKKKKPCNYQLRIHTLHQDMFSPNMREPITLLMLC